jgi:hypothetical protein
MESWERNEDKREGAGEVEHIVKRGEGKIIVPPPPPEGRGRDNDKGREGKKNNAHKSPSPTIQLFSHHADPLPPPPLLGYMLWLREDEKTWNATKGGIFGVMICSPCVAVQLRPFHSKVMFLHTLAISPLKSEEKGDRE